ncbi:MAG: hypothetical protein ABI867_04235 [Kofleriaceae bacterium]
MSRRQLVAVTAGILGCDGGTASPITIQEGSLISMAEGEQLELAATGAGALAADHPAWASLDGDRLVLAPPCNTVQGTAAVPALFTLELVAPDRSTSSVSVQVRASGSGTCQPTLLACRSAEPCSASPVRCTRDSASFAGTQLAVSYVGGNGFSDLTRADTAMVFSLDNPDASDVLAAQVTSDSPFKFRPFTPRDFPSAARQTQLCVDFPNTDVTGAFTASYVIVRPGELPPSSASPVVASGVFPLAYNEDLLFGVELVSCAVSGATTCELQRFGDVWCVRKSNASASVSVGLRIWGGHLPGHPPGADQYDLALEVTPAVSLTSTLLKRPGPGPLTLHIDRQASVDPDVVVVDIDTATDFTVRLTRTSGLAETLARPIRVRTSCP